MSKDEDVNICYICNKSFSKKSNLSRHLNKKICIKKNNELSICSEENENSEILKCEFCDKIFIKKFNLDRHLLNKTGNCFKSRTKHINKKIINRNNIVNNTYNGTYNANTYNTINNNTINNNTINIQPIITQQIIAKPGEETISHITKDVMLEILDIESFPKMCTELMRLLYFNKDVPENQNWTIVYPKNKNAGIEYNHETKRFERRKTYNIIDDKFSNMVNLLFDLVQEISNEDILNDNLSKRQKINVNKYCMHFGQLDISKTSKDVYDSIHLFAYNSRKDQMRLWGENGHKGNHLSLKF